MSRRGSEHAVVGVVLAGGASRRMGADKATLPVAGTPMATLVATALTDGGCTTVEAQGGDRSALEALGLTVFDDDEAGRGPVVAIKTALARHPAVEVVVAACDLPRLDASTVRTVVSAGRNAGARCAVATVNDEAQLVAWFAPGASESAVPEAARSVRQFLDVLAAHRVEVNAASVHNVNRPADLDLPG